MEDSGQWDKTHSFSMFVRSGFVGDVHCIGLVGSSVEGTVFKCSNAMAQGMINQRL